MMHQFNCTGSKVLDDIDARAGFLRSIKSNWQSVRNDLRSSTQISLDKVTSDLSGNRKEVEKLEASTQEKVFVKDEVRKVKSGFWRWFIGRQYAEVNYSYSGKWFDSYRCDGSHYEKTQKELGPASLKLYLASDARKDLLVDVLLHRPENKLPSTEARVNLLRHRMEEDEVQKAALLKKVIDLGATTSAGDVIAVIMNETEKVKRSHKEVEKQLQDLTWQINKDDGPPPKTWQSIKGLALLLLALRDCGAQPSELANGPQDTLKEFQELWLRAQDLQ